MISENFDKVNKCLFEELERLNNINNDDNSIEVIKTEIQRSNAMALLGKTIVQSLCVKTLADNQREKFKEELGRRLLN